jgi:propionyl-CoA carboxylase alpha chain
MESRLYAEDPYRNFLPSIGRLTRYRPPAEVEGRVRNDTGVFEGGEISMFYDPMIAKLCSWGEDRAKAIEEMRTALDRFEVEGIGHNLPFLSTVMDHPKFVSGDMTTAFIAEEFPDGFSGALLEEEDLARIALITAAMRFRVADRAGDITQQYRADAVPAFDKWVIQIGERQLDAHVEETFDDEFKIATSDGTVIIDRMDWQPGMTLCEASFHSGGTMVLKVEERSDGFRVRYRGADFEVKTYTARQAGFAQLMPVKEAPDTSKLLLCPMPGLIVAMNVLVGDEVEEGQAICTVEAMKMENVLRAERKSKVAKVNAQSGDSLAVDDVIVEFE